MFFHKFSSHCGEHSSKSLRGKKEKKKYSSTVLFVGMLCVDNSLLQVSCLFFKKKVSVKDFGDYPI